MDCDDDFHKFEFASYMILAIEPVLLCKKARHEIESPKITSQLESSSFHVALNFSFLILWNYIKQADKFIDDFPWTKNICVIIAKWFQSISGIRYINLNPICEFVIDSFFSTQSNHHINIIKLSLFGTSGKRTKKYIFFWVQPWKFIIFVRKRMDLR